jgi:hypothetical protein
MRKLFILLTGSLLISAMVFGQELIQNGDFSLPDNGKEYQRIDSIPGWLTDDVTAENNGRAIVESNAVAWHWDGAGSIYQVVGTVPATTTRYDISFDATCFYSYWSGNYVTDVYVIFSAFSGTDTVSRVTIDTVKFTVSCIGSDYMEWETLEDEYILMAGNAHAGKHLVFEIEIYDSRDFGYDESYSYLYYDNVSVFMSDATSVINVINDMPEVAYTPGMIQIKGKSAITSAVIYDLTGKRILNLNPNSSEVNLNVGHLNHGVYIMRLEMNGKMFHKKMVF